MISVYSETYREWEERYLEEARAERELREAHLEHELEVMVARMGGAPIDRETLRGLATSCPQCGGPLGRPHDGGFCEGCRAGMSAPIEDKTGQVPAAETRTRWEEASVQAIKDEVSRLAGEEVLQ